MYSLLSLLYFFPSISFALFSTGIGRAAEVAAEGAVNWKEE